MASWALQDAKARFSEVVNRACKEGPQTVTRHGRSAVVILATEQFCQLTQREDKADLVGFFRHSPLTGLNPSWLDRDRDSGREISL